MDKTWMITELLRRVEAMIERAEHEREGAQQEANSHVGAMESRYDTFKEEAQYLAGAQSARIAQLRRTSVQLRDLLSNQTRPGGNHPGVVALGSVVRLRAADGAERWYMLAPGAGGEELWLDGVTVQVITPQSPAGREVLGKAVGDDVTLRIGDQQTEFEVLALE